MLVAIDARKDNLIDELCEILQSSTNLLARRTQTCRYYVILHAVKL